MVEAVLSTPFGTEALSEIPLASPPLVKVVAQVRFPRLAALVSDDGVANLYATNMSAKYPILQEQRELSVTISPEGVNQSPGPRIWILRSADEKWQLSFGETFLALDTAGYASREDFFGRLHAALSAFLEVVRPPFAERVGVRYMNRITDQQILNDLPHLVRPGMAGLPELDVLGEVKLQQSIFDVIYRIGEKKALRARSGMLPPNVLLDPLVEPVPSASWLLDIDSFSDERIDFDASRLDEVGRSLAEQAYRYFLWIANDEFLKRHGGEV